MNMDIEVLDNLLPQSYFLQIREKITNNSNFPWYYQNNITANDYGYSDNLEIEKSGFDHLIIANDQVFSQDLYLILSGFYGLILDISNKKKVIKSRADMTLYSPNKVRHSPHVDLFFQNITCIFYITDSDAETIIYNEKIVDYENCKPFSKDYYKCLQNLTPKMVIEPKQNRMVMFDGSYIHTGHSPSKYENRILINTNLI